MSNVGLLDQRVATAFYGSFTDLRPSQEATIEPLLSGRNLILSSGTGSGKTEAIVAPLVSKYWRQAAESGSLFILYIAPTKALVNDLEKRLHLPLTSLGLHVGIRHGDRDDLISGPKPNLLITTPESLDVMLFRKEPMLQSVRAVIIDEVHLLYNTQRGLQLSILIRRLQQLLPWKLQWAALSATIGSLSYIQDFLVGEEGNAVLLNYPVQRPIDAQVSRIVNVDDFVSLVRRLTEGRSMKLLTFTNSRRECEQLASALNNEGSLKRSVFAHYSSLSSEVRVATEQAFASNNTAICIATSTLELGIDIGDIDATLLYGVPGGMESFLQRIGRGNRRSNRAHVESLIPMNSSNSSLDALRFYVMIDAASEGELPIRAPYELFGAVGQQCLSVIASDQGRFTRIADLCELVNHKSYLNRDVVESILAELATNDFLQRHGYRNSYGAQEDLHKLVDMRLIYGNFGIGSQKVDVFHSSKHLGEVPSINLLRLHKGNAVRFAGKCWHIQAISRSGIHLQPSSPLQEAVDFSYGGAGMHTDAFISDRIWRAVHSTQFKEGLLAGELKEQVRSLMDNFRQDCSFEQIPYQRSDEGIRYYTFGGYLVNKAVGFISGKAGFKADDFSLLVSSPIEWTSIPQSPLEYERVFHLLFEASSEQSIYQQQLPKELQLLEYLQDWLKDETIPLVLERLSGAAAVEISNWRA